MQLIHERMNQEALVEEYIEGRELYVSILGNKQLQLFPLSEVIFSEIPEGLHRFSTFKAKWDDAYRQKWGIQNIFAQPPTGRHDRANRPDLQKGLPSPQDAGLWPHRSQADTGRRHRDIGGQPQPNLARDDEFAHSAVKSGLSYEGLIQRIVALTFST